MITHADDLLNELLKIKEEDVTFDSKLIIIDGIFDDRTNRKSKDPLLDNCDILSIDNDKKHNRLIIKIANYE